MSQFQLTLSFGIAKHSLRKNKIFIGRQGQNSLPGAKWAPSKIMLKIFEKIKNSKKTVGKFWTIEK